MVRLRIHLVVRALWCSPILFPATVRPGVELVLYVKTIHAVLTLEKRQRVDVFHLFFSTVMFILITILFTTNTAFSREVCKIHSDYPNGASVSTMAWYSALGRVAMFILQLMSEALLVGSRRRRGALWPP